MSNPENGNFRGIKSPELTAPRGRGYHGNNMENGGERERPAERIKSEPIRELAEKIDNRDSRIGISSYIALRPDLNKWRSSDYARVLTMIGPEALRNENAKQLEFSLNKSLESNPSLQREVYSALATIEGRYDFIKKDEWNKKDEGRKGDDMASRVYYMHFELWKELGLTGGSGTEALKKFDTLQLHDYLKLVYADVPLSRNAKAIQPQLDLIRERMVKEIDRRLEETAAGGGGGGDGGDRGGDGGGDRGDGEDSWKREMLDLQRSLYRVNVEQLSELKTISLTLKEIHQDMRDLSGKLCIYDEETTEGKSNAAEVSRRMQVQTEEQQRLITERVRIEKEIKENRKKILELQFQEQKDKTDKARMENDMTRESHEEWLKRKEAKEMLLDKKPWEKKDRELFEGNVDEVLRERMMRIEYLCIKSDAEHKGITFEEAIKDHADTFLAKTARDEHEEQTKSNFMARMGENKIYESLAKSGSLEREIGTYMQELKKWAKIVEKNSQFGNGDLKITPETYSAIKKILEAKTHLYEYGAVSDDTAKAEFRKEMLNTTRLLNELDFDKKYFLKRDRDTGRLIGIKYKAEKEYVGEDTPRDLYDTCKLIEMLYPDEHYGTGQEHELFNEYGEFQLHNFLYYTYERMWEYSDRNSQSQVNLLGDIGLRTRYTEVTFGQLMEIPKYTQVRNFKLSGGSDKEEAGVGDLDVGWGDYEDHPQLNLEIRDIFKRIVWQLQVRHNGGVAFLNPNTRADVGESAKVMYELAGKGDEYRNGYLLLTMQRPSSKEDEVEAYIKHNKQGSLGKAERDANLVLRHMKELSEHYVNKDKNGKIIGVRSVDENYALKALGYDGASSLMLKVAESSMMYSERRVEMQTEFRKYQAYLMDKMRADYETGLTDAKKTELGLLVEKKKAELMGGDIYKVSIDFDSSTAINELLMAIETNIMDKSVVRDKEYDRWKDSGKVISRKAVNEETRRLVRSELKKQFFDKVLDMQITQAGASRGMAIGDIKVKTCNGRIVTDEEWENIDKSAVKGEMTIRQIFDEFGEFGARDGDRLKDDELDYASKSLDLKQRIKKANKAKDAVEVAKLRGLLAKHKANYEALYERNERLGLALLTKVAKVKRSELNYFNSAEPSRTALTISRDSIVASTSKVYGLSKKEQQVVGEGIHYDQVLNGNALINNTASPRINALSWFVRTKEMWKASRGVKPNSGLYDEVKAIMPGTWWDVISVNVLHKGIKTNYTKLLQGNGETVEEMVDREDRIQDGNRRLYDTSREEFGYKFSRYIMDGAKFIENLKKDESLELHKLVTRDAKGTLRFDTEKARKEMAEHWHPMWDAINKTGIDQEAYVRIDGKTIKNKQYLFGEKTLAAHEALVYYHKSLAAENIGTSDIHKKIAEELESKYAMSVLAAYYAASVKEHSEIFGGINDYWDPELARHMWWFLGEYFKKEGENKKGEQVEVSYMPMGMMEDVLEVEKISQKGQVLKLFLVEFIASIFDGVFSKGLKELMDELVQVEKIYRR